MKAVLIPEEAPTHVVELVSGDSKESLARLQALVGGFIEALPIMSRGDATAYINEEGKFTCVPNPRATEFMRPALYPGDRIHGPLLVCGFNPHSGENQSIPDDLLEMLMRDYE